MKWFCFLVFTFSFTLGLGAEEENDIEGAFTSSLSDTQSLLPSSVNNVSVISGEWIESDQDFVVNGPEPLTLNRSYSSKYEPHLPQKTKIKAENPCPIQNYNCGSRWSFNRPSRLFLSGDGSLVNGIFSHSSGIKTTHKVSSKNIEEGKPLPLVLHKKEGIINCLCAEISGRTNLNNTFLYYNEEDKSCTAITGRGDRTYFNSPRSSAEYEKKSSGNYILKQKNKIYTTDAKQETCFGYLTFETTEKQIQIASSDGKSAQYQFEIRYPEKKNSTNLSLSILNSSSEHEPYHPEDRSPPPQKTREELEEERQANKRYFLSKITYSHKPEINFEYTGALLKSIQHPENRFVNISYGERNKVKTILAPVGIDSTPIEKYTFDYSAEYPELWKKELCTTVYDAEGHKMEYLHNREKRLTSQRKFSGSNKKSYSLHCSEEYIWDDEYYRIDERAQSTRYHLILIPPFNIPYGKGVTPPIRVMPSPPIPLPTPKAIVLPEKKPVPALPDPKKIIEDYTKKPQVARGTLTPVSIKELLIKNIEAKEKRKLEQQEFLNKLANPKLLFEEYIKNRFGSDLKAYYAAYRPGEGNLLAKCFKDASDEILLARFFDYDERGNILTDTTYGNLSGTNATPIEINEIKQPIQNGTESYQKQYTYSDDGFNLLLSEKEDSGKGLLYFYVPDTDLKAAKLLLDNDKIYLREYYEYDQNTALTKSIRDNGCGLEKDDLSGVTERHITYLKPRVEIPVGVPELIDEMYFDFEKGQEVLLKRVVCTYALDGKITYQTHYDAEGKYCYTLHWDYDAHGNLITEINALGQVVSKEYDANDNLIRERGPNPNRIKDYQYDYSNRLISVTETFLDKTFTTSYKYDVLGNRISSIDRSGNETKYEYDDLNRVVKTIYPAVLDENEKPVYLATTTEYDIFNNPVVVTDPRGHKTQTTYNAYGKPTSIRYADNTFESFEYNLNGTLAKSITQNGSYTLYNRDAFGRVLEEETFTPDGSSIKKSCVYQGARLVQSTDPEGCVTYHKYDGAGRLIQTICGDNKKTIQYNALGRIARTIEHGQLDNDNKIEVFEYDFLGQVLQQRVEDVSGQVLRKVSYSYDIDGNQTEIIEETDAGPCITVTEFDGDKKPIKMTDGLGHVTKIDYDYHYVENGLQLLKVTATDPEGKISIQVLDALGRVIKTSKLNAFGLLLSLQTCFYDAGGNLIRVKDSVIEEGKETRQIQTLWGYNALNDEISLIEALGTPEQKITYTYYNQLGEKETILKPDGTHLKHSYDYFGRLQSLNSSDGTISYYYEYNKNHQVIKVSDFIHNAETTREYDQQGRLTNEVLSNNLTTHYEYDSANRLIHIKLPDNSGINYIYNAAFLKEVHRTKNNQRVYSHYYDKHDLGGNVTQSLNIVKNTLKHTYDLLKRPTQISTPCWSQTMPKDAYDSLGRLKKYTIKDPAGTTPYDFNYNDLNSLVSEKGHASHTYSADSIHNRTSKDNVSCSLNSLNQLLQQGDWKYNYDRNGNLKEKRNKNNVTQFYYDALNRLIQVTKDDLVTQYEYDSFNRRVFKNQENKIQKYIYIGLDEIGSADENNEIQELRILGKGIDAEIGSAIALEIAGQTLAPIHDYNGNVVCLMNGPEAVESYRYTAFGEEQIFDEQGKQIAKSKINNPWRYASKRVDEETGFVYFGRRYYDPDIGRWITPDPLGFGDGPNLYAYLHHSPNMSHDAYGLYDENSCYAYNDSCAAANMSPFLEASSDKESSMYLHGDDAYSEAPLTPEEYKRLSRVAKFYYFESLFIGDKSACYRLFRRNSDGVGFIGGIFSFLNDSRLSADYLSLAGGGINVDFVHNATHFIFDLLECVLGLCGIATEPVKKLHEQWDYYFDNAALDATYLQFAFSQGCIHLRNALLSYPEERRNRIVAVGICPGGYTYKDSCKEVYHYRAEFRRDFVPYLDIGGAIRESGTITTLKSHQDAPRFDHSFVSPTFRQVITDHLDEHFIHNRN